MHRSVWCVQEEGSVCIALSAAVCERMLCVHRRSAAVCKMKAVCALQCLQACARGGPCVHCSVCRCVQDKGALCSLPCMQAFARRGGCVCTAVSAGCVCTVVCKGKRVRGGLCALQTV